MAWCGFLKSALQKDGENGVCVESLTTALQTDGAHGVGVTSMTTAQ